MECKVEGCTKETKVKGFCHAHYLHNYRYGTPYTHTTKYGVAKNNQYEYNSYRSMKNRCLCKTDKNYPRWGGRGVTICDRWLGADGFANFLSDMGPRPEGHTLDRIDNNGNYCPENCRWATPYEQMANTRPMEGRFPGVYYIKNKGKWCANFQMGTLRITKSLPTMRDAIVKRKEWKKKYLCREDKGEQKES